MKKLIIISTICILFLSGCTQVSNTTNNKTYSANELGYKIGSDIPEGEYYFVANNDTTASIGLANTSNPQSIADVTYMNSFENSFYLTLNKSDGYLLFSDATAYPSAIKPIPNLTKDSYYAPGSYKIGSDIPSGNYILELQNKVNIGKYFIYSDSSYNSNSLVTSGVITFDNPVEITLSEGQYLYSGVNTIIPN